MVLACVIVLTHVKPERPKGAKDEVKRLQLEVGSGGPLDLYCIYISKFVQQSIMLSMFVYV